LPGDEDHAAPELDRIGAVIDLVLVQKNTRSWVE